MIDQTLMRHAIASLPSVPGGAEACAAAKQLHTHAADREFVAPDHLKKMTCAQPLGFAKVWVGIRPLLEHEDTKLYGFKELLRHTRSQVAVSSVGPPRCSRNAALRTPSAINPTCINVPKS